MYRIAQRWCLDGEVHEQTHLLRQQLIVRCKGLMDGEFLEIVYTRLYGHLDINTAQCTAGRVDGHLAIEGGVERILGLEVQHVMLLIAHLYAIC